MSSSLLVVEVALWFSLLACCAGTTSEWHWQPPVGTGLGQGGRRLALAGHIHLGGMIEMPPSLRAHSVLEVTK
jgi:hypothetical protein